MFIFAVCFFYSWTRSSVVNESRPSWSKIIWILRSISVFFWWWNIFLRDQVVDWFFLHFWKIIQIILVFISIFSFYFFFSFKTSSFIPSFSLISLPSKKRNYLFFLISPYGYFKQIKSSFKVIIFFSVKSIPRSITVSLFLLNAMIIFY